MILSLSLFQKRLSSHDFEIRRGKWVSWTSTTKLHVRESEGDIKFISPCRKPTDNRVKHIEIISRARFLSFILNTRQEACNCTQEGKLIIHFESVPLELHAVADVLTFLENDLYI